MATRQTYQLRLTAFFVGIALLSASAQADIVNWRTNVDAAKIEAAQSGRLLLMHFWSPSCGPCRKLDSDVFSQPQISALLEQNFTPIKVNVELSPALANAYNITRVPTDVVLTPQGNVIASLSCPLRPADYGTQLANLVQHYRQSTAQHQTAMQPPVQAAYAGLKVGQYQNAIASNATPAVQPTQQNQQSAPVAVSSPQVTNNVYASAPQTPPAPAVTAPPAAPTYSNRYATTSPPTPPAATRQVVTQPTFTPPPATPAVQQSAQPQVAAVAYRSTAANTQATVTPPKQAGPPQLPPGSAPLAFEGYCPVTLKQVHKWVMGNSQFGATHRGRTYLFTGEQQRQQFLANPDAFSPVFSGMDAVKLLEENQTVEGSRKYGFEYRGAFYLFSSKDTMDRFASQPDRYAAGVRQAMTRMDASAGGTIHR